jgi:hypothetical protein
MSIPRGCLINSTQKNTTSNYVLLQSTDPNKEVYGKVSDWLVGQYKGNRSQQHISGDWAYWYADPNSMHDIGCFVWSPTSFIENTNPNATCTASGNLGPDILWTSTDDQFFHTTKPENTNGYYCGWTGQMESNPSQISFADTDDGQNGLCTAAFTSSMNPSLGYLKGMSCSAP